MRKFLVAISLFAASSANAQKVDPFPRGRQLNQDISPICKMRGGGCAS